MRFLYLKDLFYKLYLNPRDLLRAVLTDRIFLYIFILDIVYSSLFNIPIYYVYQSEGFYSAQFLIRSYFITILLNYVILLFLALSRILFYITVPLLFLISSITTYLIFNFRVKLSMNAMAVFFETNLDEASGVAGSEMIGSMIISLLLGVLSVIFFRRSIKNINRKAISYVIILQTLFVNLPIMKYFSYHFRGIPNDLYIYGKEYLKEKKRSIKMARKRVDLSERYRFEYKDQDLIVVLIIGEAARGINFSLNGYNRETDPNLKAIGAISFENAYSCGTITRVSIPCMLTRATFRNQDLSKREKSVISIFNSLGFETYWISNQGVMGEHETPISPIINESKNKIFVNISGAYEDRDVLDENIIPVFKNLIQKEEKRAFVVINLIGSHWYYEHHYPKSFRRFTPVCQSRLAQRCTREELTNSYDNTILYTDYVVSEIMKSVEGRNGIVFFVSDHGESLGEDGVYTHRVENIDRLEQRSIAWFVYVTEEFKRRHKEFYENLLENRHKYISHDNLFHSLLDCASIESEVVDREMSICRKIKW